ncbi:hypothetical protein [Streptomyces syringium]|uniref:hypothetical protein n=1 Tax=Streptomyces syringium TaxID=76729 RepID=UPI0037CE3617
MIGHLLRGTGRRRAVDEVARLRHLREADAHYIARLKADLVLTSRDLETARRQRDGALAALYRRQKTVARVLVIRVLPHGATHPAHIPDAA